MKHYLFADSLSNIQRNVLVIALRRAGFYAYQEQGELVTVASLLVIGLVWGNTNAVKR